MGMSVDVISYKTKEIEKIINEYPQINLREAFETCGKFLGEYYIILDNEYAHEENPAYQLDYWLDELLAQSKGIKLNYEEVEEEGYENVEISNKLNTLSSREYDTVPTWMNRFEYIKYEDIYGEGEGEEEE